MLEDNFVVSLLVLWLFLLQCSAQTHQLRLIPIPRNGCTRFQQFIIHHTELVPSNAEQNLGTVNIRSGHRRGGLLGHSPGFSALGIIVVNPFFVAGHKCDVKTSSDSVFEAAVHKQRNAVQQLSASTRTEPNFLVSESFPWR